MTGLAPAVAMLAVIVLTGGGIYMLQTDRRKGVLMLACATVIFGNLLIWTI